MNSNYFVAAAAGTHSGHGQRMGLKISTVQLKVLPTVILFMIIAYDDYYYFITHCHNINNINKMVCNTLGSITLLCFLVS